MAFARKIFIVFLFCASFSGGAAGKTYSLPECIEIALANSQLMRAAGEDIEFFEAKYKEAVSAALPKGEIKTILTLIPGQRGDPLNGYTNWDELGVFSYSEIQGILPLYTFGKISSLKEMAKRGMDVSKAKEEIARWEVISRVKKSYYSLVLFSELDGIISEGKEYLDKAKKRIEKLENEDSPEFDQIDKLKVKVYEADVESRSLGAKRAMKLARSALKLMLSVDAGESFDAADGQMKEVNPDILPLEEYLKTAVKNRAELVALQKGIAAKRAEVEFRKSQFYPDIFFAGYFKLGWSDVTDGQKSPFAYDPYRTYTGGGGIGLKMDLDFFKKNAELEAVKAELGKLEALFGEAVNGTRLELEKVYMEMTDIKSLIGINKAAMEAARGWLIAKSDMYDTGFCELNEVLTALVQFYEKRIGYLNSIYEFNIAAAGLEKIISSKLTNE
ncbi:MAG: TolC family protein [Deltaproteobacteria bacterium]|nr:TolC family protein [Deltaproteobacteria bacterium]